MDEMAGHEADGKARREVPSEPAPRASRRALPDPARQHGLDGQGQEEVEPEECPGLRGQQAERQDAEVVPVFGEDQAVEHQEAQCDAGQQHADREDH